MLKYLKMCKKHHFFEQKLFSFRKKLFLCIAKLEKKKTYQYL